MRFDSSLIIAGFLVVLAAAAIVAFNPSHKASESGLQMAVRTDKHLYHSGEIVHFFVNLSGSAENATLSVKGIRDSRGGYRVQKDYSVPPLEREMNFTFAMPSCYGCAGIAPGDYEISAELFCGGALAANSTTAVRLEK